MLTETKTTTRQLSEDLTPEQVADALRAYVAQLNDCPVPGDAVVRVTSRATVCIGASVSWVEVTSA